MPDNALTSCRGFRNENCSWQQHACCRCSNNLVVGHASVSRRRRGCGSLRVGCFGAVFRVLSHALGAGEIHAQTGEGSQIATRDSSTGGSQGAELEFESGRVVPSAEARPTAAGRTTARWHTTPHWQSSAPEQDVAPASGVRLVEVRPVEAPATQLHAQTPGQSKDEYNVGDRSGRRGSARIKVA